jgi:hypothetical protein
VPEVGGSDRIGFFRSGYAREYITQIRDYELKNVTHITTRKMSMQQIIDILGMMAADRKANQEELLARMDKMDAKISKAAKQEEMLAELNAKMDANLAVIKSTINAFTEKFEQDPGMMQSVEEHQDVRSEDIVVRELKKRHRGRKSTAGRREEPKELTRGNHGTRRKLAAPGRKVSRRATVARRKRNVFRQIWTDINCGPRSTLAAAGRRMTCSAKMTQGTEHGLRKQGEDNIAPKTWKGRTKNKRLKNTTCKSDIRDRG